MSNKEDANIMSNKEEAKMTSNKDDDNIMSNKEEELPKIICSVCENFLSVFPVFAYEVQNTFLFTCGRCPSKQDVILHHQIAYESSVQDKLFPCKYSTERCTVKLRPDDLQQHEMYCETRQCVCPFLNPDRCGWMGKCRALHSHYTREHASFVFNSANEVALEVDKEFENYYLWRSKDDVFLIYLRNSTSSIEFFYYVMCLISSRPCEAKYIEGKKVNPVEDFQDLKFEPETLMKVNPTFVIKLRRSKDETADEQIEISRLPQMQENILKCLECAICMEFMRPPIANCATGHSFCESCVVGLMDCPVCRKTTSWGHNSVLGNILQFIIYPCRGSKLGCPVALPLKEIETHEQSECLFKSFKCPFRTCAWRDRPTKFIEHIQIGHKLTCIKGRIHKMSLDTGIPRTSCGFVDYDDNIFYVVQKFNGRKYMCSTMLAGPRKNFDDYEFECQIRDLEDDREILLLRKKCLLMTKTCSEDSSPSMASIVLNLKSMYSLQSYVRIIKKTHLDL